MTYTKQQMEKYQRIKDKFFDLFGEGGTGRNGNCLIKIPQATKIMQESGYY